MTERWKPQFKENSGEVAGELVRGNQLSLRARAFHHLDHWQKCRYQQPMLEIHHRSKYHTNATPPHITLSYFIPGVNCRVACYRRRVSAYQTITCGGVSYFPTCRRTKSASDQGLLQQGVAGILCGPPVTLAEETSRCLVCVCISLERTQHGTYEKTCMCCTRAISTDAVVFCMVYLSCYA